MSDKLKQILKLGGSYGLANVYHQVLMLVVIPIYTKYLTTEDYGIAGLMSITAGLILSFTKSPASYGLNRHYFAPGYEHKRGELLLSTVVFALFQSTLFAAAFYLFSDLFAELILESADYSYIIKIYSLIILLQPLEELFQDLAKLQKKAKLLSWMHVFNISFSVVLILILLIVFKLNFMALIYGALSITLFTFIYLLPNTLNNISWKIDLDILKPVLKFGYPMLFAVISLYSMKNIDMYIVRSLIDVSASGQYHFGYKFGALLSYFFLLPLKSIIEPMIYELENDIVKLRKFVSEIGTYLFAASMAICLALSLFAKELLLLLASKPEFESAWVIVPVIAFAHVYFGMLDIYGRGIIMAKKSFQFGILYFSGAIINIVLNYIWIPKIGIMGAALATLVAYFYISIISAIMSKKYYSQTFEWLKINMITFLAITFYSLIFVKDFPLIQTLLFKFVLLLAFIIVVFFLIITKEDRSKFKSMIAKRIIK